VSEADLLKSLAAHYKVFFISTEKLAKAEVSRAVVNTIPQRFAEKIGVCPIAFDAKSHMLSVITADPDDRESLGEVQLASGAREVKPILARPAAVKAFLLKIYGGDPRAFDVLDRNANIQFQVMYARDDIALDERSEVASPATASVARAASIASTASMASNPAAPRARPSPLEPPSRDRVLPRSPPPHVKVVERSPPGPAAALSPAQAPPASLPAANDTGVSEASFIELLRVLVSMIETSRADLRGHSAQVARLARRMAEKLGLDTTATAILIAGTFIHDLGKAGSFHLTAFNCSEYDGHKAAAQKAHNVPARLLEPVRLPADSIAAVSHMYERFDGRGFPDGLAGKEIPLAARVIAICDTYADLTSNPRNPFRKILSPNDACAVLTKYKNSIFDPNLVDLFKTTVLGEELTARLLASRAQALVVDTDPEETTVLELRMSEQGFAVKTARNAEQALQILAEGETDLVVSEIDLGASDGLTLLAEARTHAWGQDVAWVAYTRRQERAIAQKAFELGVLDYVTKPASADVLVAKLKALLDQRANRNARGVSGSLREMGLPDMVQVLFHGRKSGSLKIRAREGTGEIHFADGNVVDASWRELRGEEAFYAMLKIGDGEFALDPAFRAVDRIIHQSSEALLLEGMRRLDEGLS
jgi:response regulator RpfG family c-di-GMP phosphodiesterase